MLLEKHCHSSSVVEHVIGNDEVGGSIPLCGTSNKINEYKNMKKIDQAATILYNTRIKVDQISELPNYCTPKNKNEGYEIQNMLVKKYTSLNRKTFVIGKKSWLHK